MINDCCYCEPVKCFLSFSCLLTLTNDSLKIQSHEIFAVATLECSKMAIIRASWIYFHSGFNSPLYRLIYTSIHVAFTSHVISLCNKFNKKPVYQPIIAAPWLHVSFYTTKQHSLNQIAILLPTITLLSWVHSSVMHHIICRIASPSLDLQKSFK